MTRGLIWSGYVHKGCGGKIVGKNKHAHCEICNECIHEDDQAIQGVSLNRGKLFYVRFWRDAQRQVCVAEW